MRHRHILLAACAAALGGVCVPAAAHHADPTATLRVEPACIVPIERCEEPEDIGGGVMLTRCIVSYVPCHHLRRADWIPAPADPTPEDAAMAYATRADLVARFGGDEIDDLAPLDTPEGAPATSARAAAVLDDASAEVDATLAGRYIVPLSGDWPTLTALTCDLARARLYDDAAPERVLGRLSSARKRLRELAAGERYLVSATGDFAPVRERGAISAGVPVATRERLAGYLGPGPGAGPRGRC